MLSTRILRSSPLVLIVLLALYSCDKEKCKTCYFEKTMYENKMLISDKKSQNQVFCDNELDDILKNPEMEDSTIIDGKHILICMKYFCNELSD